MYDKAVLLPYSMGVKEQEYMNWMRIEMLIAIPLAKSRLLSFKAMIGCFSSDESVIEVVSEKNYSSHNDSDDVDCDDIDNKSN